VLLLFHMLCLLIELCLLNLACLIIILGLLMGIKGLVIKTSILSLLVIIVALVVISTLIAFRFVLKNLGINCIYLGRVNQVFKPVKNLSDQVKLISEKLGNLTPNEKKSVLTNNEEKTFKQVWVKKEDNLCLVAHTALKILDICLWYLDSGFSKHMTRDKTLLKEVYMGEGGRFTYGDGSQSKVIGKGIIDIPGLRASQEALYVEGLKANLLSICEFYDNDLVVQFFKKDCNIFDSSGKWLIGGEMTADNCYGLLGLTSDPQIICNKATVDDSE